jgi:caffeoyl-CoA O-methyltransferase
MDLLLETLQRYLDTHTTPEPAHLQALNRETHLKVLMPRMLSGHYQGRILALFSHMLRPRLILEIGTYTGYSALCLAEGLAEGGTLITLDINEELEDSVRAHFEKAGLNTKIDFRIGNALDLLPQVEGHPELVFIDADKINYLKYYEMVLPKMPVGGILIADNVLWSGKVMDEHIQDKDTRALREFNSRIQADPRVENVLLPIRDGLMVVRKIV